MASRNRFARGGTPLRQVQLADPFTTMVANINKQLAFLQQQKALAALANGDPDGFLTLAQGVLKNVTGDEKNLWQDLIKKANGKIEETAWAAEVNSGRASLEDFKQHLNDKLSQAQQGTQESYDLITSIDGVNKSIKARDGAKADQAALLQYTNDNNHEAYAQYLIKKLQSTTDPTAYQTLRNQIETLRARTASDEQVGRVRARGDAMEQYLNGSISAASAIQKLQELALDPKITATEVANLQQLVTNVHDREEANARRASSGGSAAMSGFDTVAFNKNLATYNADASEVDRIIKNGGDPSVPLAGQSQSPLDRLRASSSILTDQYQTAASIQASRGQDPTQEQNHAQTVQNFLGAVPGRIDQVLIENATGDTLAQFNANVKDLSTAAARGKSRADRIAALSRIAPQLKTPESQQKVQAEINVLSSDARGEATKLSQTDNLGPKDRKDIHELYQSYSQLAQKSGGKPVSFEDFMRAATDAAAKGKDPTDIARIFAGETGLKLNPQLSLPFGNFGDMNQFSGQTDTTVQASDIVKQVADISSRSDLLSNQEAAKGITKTLLETPGGIPFGPPGSPQYQVMGLTASDVWDMRVGAGITTVNPYMVNQHQAQERADMAQPYSASPAMQQPGQPTPTQQPGMFPAPLVPGMGFGGHSPSMKQDQNNQDLTSYENSADELRQELRLQRESQRQAEQAAQPSIEDTLLASTPPPMDLSMFAQADQGIQTPQPDKYAGMDPQWADAYNYLDSGQSVDVPGFQIPSLPDPLPYVDTSVLPYSNPFSGSDPGGPPPVDYGPAPEAPAPNYHGNY